MHFQNSKHFLIPVYVDRKLTYSIHIKVAYSKFFFLRFRYVVDKSLMFTCNGGWGDIQILEKKNNPKMVVLNSCHTREQENKVLCKNHKVPFKKEKKNSKKE